MAGEREVPAHEEKKTEMDIRIESFTCACFCTRLTKFEKVKKNIFLRMVIG